MKRPGKPEDTNNPNIENAIGRKGRVLRPARFTLNRYAHNGENMTWRLNLFSIRFCLVVAVACVLIFLNSCEPTVEQEFQAVLEATFADPTTPLTSKKEFTEAKFTFERRDFLNAYLPMIANASPEVKAIMMKFDAKHKKSVGNNDLDIEKLFPTDEWLQKYLDMDIAINDYSDYSDCLSTRSLLWHAHKDIEDLIDTKDRLNLNADASWDEVVDAQIRTSVKLDRLVKEASAKDWRVGGGSLSNTGVFIPNRMWTVYIQTDGSAISMHASRVPQWVMQELAHRGSGSLPDKKIPWYVDIIFLDKAGNKLVGAAREHQMRRFQIMK